MNAPSKGKMQVTDDEIRHSVERGQLKLQRQRGTDMTVFSPRASWMGHHFRQPAHEPVLDGAQQ